MELDRHLGDIKNYLDSNKFEVFLVFSFLT